MAGISFHQIDPTPAAEEDLDEARAEIDELQDQVEDLKSRTDYLLGYLCGLAVGVALLFLNVIILHN